MIRHSFLVLDFHQLLLASLCWRTLTPISPILTRLIDPAFGNADSIMPAYARTDGLTQVGKPWRGKPILSAQQIEDVVAYLVTLR